MYFWGVNCNDLWRFQCGRLVWNVKAYCSSITMNKTSALGLVCLFLNGSPTRYVCRCQPLWCCPWMLWHLGCWNWLLSVDVYILLIDHRSGTRRPRVIDKLSHVDQLGSLSGLQLHGYNWGWVLNHEIQIQIYHTTTRDYRRCNPM